MNTEEKFCCVKYLDIAEQKYLFLYSGNPHRVRCLLIQKSDVSCFFQKVLIIVLIFTLDSFFVIVFCKFHLQNSEFRLDNPLYCMEAKRCLVLIS